MPTAKDIWTTLSAIDVNENTESKGNLTYLSWAWAWGTMMDTYPEACYTFDDPVFYQDGSMEVRCTVIVEGLTRSMWLPVMDNRNNAVKEPDARKISDTKMRCLVKCLAMFGLGHYIYAGEDLPTESKSKEAREMFASLQKTMVDDVDSLDSLEDWGTRNADNIKTLPNDWQGDIKNQYRDALKYWKEPRGEGFDGSSDQ